MRRFLLAVACALVLAPPAQARDADVRFATFNASLNRGAAGQLVDHLSTHEVDDVIRRHAWNVAEALTSVLRHVLLLNQFVFSPEAVDLSRDNFLEVSQNCVPPIEYSYAFTAPSNTSPRRGKIFSNDGTV